MTSVARRIKATPVRTASETWALMVELISAADDSIRTDLETAGNAAAMLIAEEHTQADPIILSGCGPQVRLYTLHASAAMDGAAANEQPLALNTPADDWKLALPATGVDFDIAQTAVEGNAHVCIYNPTQDSTREAAASVADVSPPVLVDLTALED